MDIRSLGLRTDLIFPAFDGEILDRGDYLVVRSPLNPTFYWGNFLLFSQAPRQGDLEKWRDLFAREIGVLPSVEHQAFAWDSPEGETGFLEPFEQAGFDVNRDVVLTASAPRPPVKSASGVITRPLQSSSDWEMAVELQVLLRDAGHAEQGYREFRLRSMDRYRKMQEAGLGNWYGAFIGGRLVADLGVFHDGRGLGRYQTIETHAEFRRRGIAGMLIHEAGLHAIGKHGLHTLVIIAAEEGAPARLYRSLGFEPAEKSVALLWWNRAEAPSKAARASRCR